MSPSNLPTERAVVPDDALAAALSEFADVVGPANVLVSEEAKQSSGTRSNQRGGTV